MENGIINVWVEKCVFLINDIVHEMYILLAEDTKCK